MSDNVKEEVKDRFRNSTKEELLEILGDIAEDVYWAEDPEVIIGIHERLGVDLRTC